MSIVTLSNDRYMVTYTSNSLVDATGRYRSRILSIGELLSVVLPQMLKDGPDLSLLISGEGGHLRPP